LPLNPAVARRIAGARFYSENAAAKATTEQKDEAPKPEKGENGEDVKRVEETEKDEVEVTPVHEVAAKLKKKEAEVTDLMVCLVPHAL